MNDPYKVLGVSRDADDEHIKKAYRELAKKYHPDKYKDSDLAELASEKMKEVNAAYDQIQQERANGGSAYNANNGPYTSSGYAGGNEIYAQIRRLINTGYIAEAAQQLDRVTNHDAEWHFLKGVLEIRMGHYVDAQRYFDTACSMDPQNAEYHAASERLRKQANAYGGGYNTSASTGGCSCCDICSHLLCLDCCCESMGGDFISCC